MSHWPIWALLPFLIVVIGVGGFGGSFVVLVILELAGQGPEARRRKRMERDD